MLFCFFNDTATPVFYTHCPTLSLHDALPFSPPDPPHPSGKPSTTKLLREQDRPSPPAMRASRLFPRSCRQCRWQAACQFRRWSACHLCVCRSAGRRQWSSSRANPDRREGRSEEHTSELQSLIRISYAVCCLKKKKSINQTNTHLTTDD